MKTSIFKMKTSIFNKSFVSSVLVFGCLARPAAAEFTIPPYIQHPGTTTMTVMWESDTLDEATVTVRQEAQEPRIVTAPKPVTVTFHEPWNDPSSPEADALRLFGEVDRPATGHELHLSCEDGGE